MALARSRTCHERVHLRRAAGDPDRPRNDHRYGVHIAPTQESAYALPLVPDAWLPADRTTEFCVSTTIIGTALLGGAVLQWIRGVSINFFANGVMYAIRVDANENMQRFDMTFFDNKETGEVMSILNNDTPNLEMFFDNVLGQSVRISIIVVGITAALLYTNW